MKRKRESCQMNKEKNDLEQDVQVLKEKNDLISKKTPNWKKIKMAALDLQNLSKRKFQM